MKPGRETKEMLRHVIAADHAKTDAIRVSRGLRPLYSDTANEKAQGEA